MALCQGLTAGRIDDPTADIVDVRSLELPYSIGNQNTLRILIPIRTCSRFDDDLWAVVVI